MKSNHRSPVVSCRIVYPRPAMLAHPYASVVEECELLDRVGRDGAELLSAYRRSQERGMLLEESA